MKEYAPIVVRIGVSLVFLYFGISQLIDAESFVGWLPNWAQGIHMSYPWMHKLYIEAVTSVTFIHFNGIFEIIFGSLLILGLFTKLVAFLLALHLLGIVITLGFNEIGVRDFGLMMATFSVFLNGSDKFSLDKKRKV